MKFSPRFRSGVLVALTAALVFAPAARTLAADSPHTSAFTYQGRLRQGGQPPLPPTRAEF